MINHQTNDKSKKRPIQKRQIYKLMINKDNQIDVHNGVCYKVSTLFKV